MARSMISLWITHGDCHSKRIPKEKKTERDPDIQNIWQSKEERNIKIILEHLTNIFFYQQSRAVKFDKQSTAVITNLYTLTQTHTNVAKFKHAKTCDSFTCFLYLRNPFFPRCSFIHSPPFHSHRALTHSQYFCNFFSF